MYFLCEFISLWHSCGGILAHSFLQFIEVCTALFTAFQQVEVWTWLIATHWIFPLFQPFCVDLLLCLGSLSCFTMTHYFGPILSRCADGLTFNSRVFWCTEEFMVSSVTARCRGLVAAKNINKYQTRCVHLKITFGSADRPPSSKSTTVPFQDLQLGRAPPDMIDMTLTNQLRGTNIRS